jgi:integrase
MPRKKLPPPPVSVLVESPPPVVAIVKTDSKLLRDLKSARDRIAELETRGPDFSDPALKEQVRQVRALQDRARAPRTLKEYEKAFKSFEAWCAKRGYSSLPASVETLQLYLKDLHQGPTPRRKHGKMPRSIGVSVAAIAHEHTVHGRISPHQSPLIKNILRGIRNEKGLAPKQKAPVETDLVRRLLRAIERDVANFEPSPWVKENGAKKQIASNELRGKRDKALFLVCFAGAMRRDEVSALKFENLEFVKGRGVNIFLGSSKTDQEQQGTWIAIDYEEDKKVCPVRALEAWIRAANIKFGPLFPSVSQWGEIGDRLEGYDVARILKKRAEQLGVPIEDLSGHSFRAGVATSMYKDGVKLVDISARLRHRKLETTRGYIRKLESFDNNPTAGLLSKKERK